MGKLTIYFYDLPLETVDFDVASLISITRGYISMIIPIYPHVEANSLSLPKLVIGNSAPCGALAVARFIHRIRPRHVWPRRRSGARCWWQRHLGNMAGGSSFPGTPPIESSSWESHRTTVVFPRDWLLEADIFHHSSEGYVLIVGTFSEQLP